MKIKRTNGWKSRYDEHIINHMVVYLYFVREESAANM